MNTIIKTLTFNVKNVIPFSPHFFANSTCHEAL